MMIMTKVDWFDDVWLMRFVERLRVESSRVWIVLRHNDEIRYSCPMILGYFGLDRFEG